MSMLTRSASLGGSQEGKKAQTMFREMVMEYCLDRTEKALEKLRD